VTTFVLVHDEHGHAGESKTGCSGTFADLGANGQPALTSIDQNVVQMRRQQVEFVVEQSGTTTANTNDPEGGGLHRGSLASGDWIGLNRRYFLGNMNKKIRFRFAGGAADNPAGADRVNVEIRSGSATGDLITTVTLKSTGTNNNTWSTQEFDLDFAGSQRLFLVFRQIPGGPAAANNTYGNLNWVEFTGPGAGIPASP
jgi:cytochrome c